MCRNWKTIEGDSLLRISAQFVLGHSVYGFISKPFSANSVVLRILDKPKTRNWFIFVHTRQSTSGVCRPVVTASGCRAVGWRLNLPAFCHKTTLQNLRVAKVTEMFSLFFTRKNLSSYVQRHLILGRKLLKIRTNQKIFSIIENSFSP